MQNDRLQGIVLFAHGSRDPLWRLPIEAVAKRIEGIAPKAIVRCAFLELTDPDLPSSVAELAALNVTSITVVPMFLGVGKHAREDLPVIFSSLVSDYPQIAFKLRPSIAEEPDVVDVMAKIAVS